jgi:hypothetical protein
VLIVLIGSVLTVHKEISSKALSSVVVQLTGKLAGIAACHLIKSRPHFSRALQRETPRTFIQDSFSIDDADGWRRVTFTFAA